MEGLFLGITKYIFIIVFAFFALFSFITLSDKKNNKSMKAAFALQAVILYIFHFTAGAVCYLNTKDISVIVFYVIQLIFFIMFRGLYSVFYEEKYDKGLINTVSMFLDISFMMLTRLNYDKAIKQFFIVCFSAVLALIIPAIIRKFKSIPHLTYLYCFTGLFFLGVVLIVGSITHGAKLFLSFHGFTFQPSEFVKILFVFFLAAFLYKDSSFKRIVYSALLAGIHVIILVLSKDLGSALIFFIVYIIMIYIASKHLIYIIAGLIGGSCAGILGYKLFSHVRVRVQAFLDPWSDIQNSGYQVAQSLFAIGTGGFLGLGLYKGMPQTVPEVEVDFMFAAIAEELGSFFAIILIILCASCFISICNIAIRQKNMFYKLVAVGLSISYAVQTILTIGGAIKFIPSTGVTLPLISYGGSSILCTMIMFAVFQGLSVYAADMDEEELEDDEY